MRFLVLTVAFVGAAAAAFLLSRPSAEPEKKEKEKAIEKGKTVGDLAHQLEEAWSDHHTLVA
ncbi:hypothetical protein FTW19_03715 [Terriglobus albidus]|uniref:YtxH domain-containing protein n=1 Tax=Terriglobus albidus TaxID=1592106 RepID=A0A5B9EAT3_9BACT|nr:hypothetical protein [Terriglobus albidus]QEE27196.1 hypothetical protein FTW19_03715 [Terriglobus albidus]